MARIYSLATFVVFHSSLISCSPTRGEPSWTEWGNSLYSIVSTGVNYTEAVESCHQYGAYVAVPSSPAENDFMWNLYQDSNLTRGMWIGCTQNQEGNWTCAEGQRPSIDTNYRNWSPSNPNRFMEPVLCPVIAAQDWADDDGQWNSVKCTDIKTYMCEKIISSPALSRLTIRLIRAVESKHLSRMTMHGQTKYSVDEDLQKGAESYEMSVLSTDATEGRMKVVSRSIAVRYFNSDN